MCEETKPRGLGEAPPWPSSTLTSQPNCPSAKGQDPGTRPLPVGEGSEDHRRVLKIEVGGGPLGGWHSAGSLTAADSLYAVVLWPRQSPGWRELLITAEDLGWAHPPHTLQEARLRLRPLGTLSGHRGAGLNAVTRSCCFLEEPQARGTRSCAPGQTPGAPGGPGVTPEIPL